MLSKVWLVNLTVGTEISKTRPCVIVNDNAIGILPLKVIVPITDWKGRYAARSWMVSLDITSKNGLTKLSAVDTFQIRSVSETRLIRKLGHLPDFRHTASFSSIGNCLEPARITFNETIALEILKHQCDISDRQADELAAFFHVSPQLLRSVKP